jgi:hypothetical protein
MCWHGEPPSLSVPKHDVTRPVLVVIDAQAVGNNLQILNPPVAWITPHFGDELRRVRHNYMVSQAVPHSPDSVLDFMRE